jgi:hypothetical protein
MHTNTVGERVDESLPTFHLLCESEGGNGYKGFRRKEQSKSPEFCLSG